MYEVTRRKGTGEALRESKDRHDFLLSLSDRLRPVGDPKAVMRAASDLLGEVLSADRVTYAEVEGDEYIVSQEHRREGLVSIAGSYPMSSFRAAELEAFQAARTVIIDDIRAEPGISEAEAASYDAVDARAFVSVPLVKDGSLVAVLSAMRSRPSEWTPWEVGLVEEVAERTWAAVERARFEKELREREERQAFLLELSDALRPLTDAMEIQTVAMRRLAERLGVMRAGYYEFEADQDTFSLTAGWEEPGVIQLPDGRSLSAFGPAIRDGYMAGRTLFVRDTEKESQTEAHRRAFRSVGVRAWIGVPLVKGGRLLTAVGVHSTGPRDWTPAEISLVEDLAERTWASVARARAETALRASEERLRALVNASSDVVYRMSPDWQVMWELDGRGFINDAREPTTGWLSDYIAPEDQRQVQKAIRKAIETKSVFQLEHRIKRPDGTLGWTLSRAVPLMNEAGDIVEWFGAASDVTERREAVEALAHSQRLDAVERLAGSIAHDFNNLLTVVIANIELAEMHSDEEARKSFLAKAMSAAQLGEDLNNRLLVWAGKSAPRPRVLNLNKLVLEMSTILDRSIGERIALTLDLADDLWPAFVDPVQVDSAVLNLAVNARDAMPDGGEIRLVTSNATVGSEMSLRLPEAKSGEYVCLTITDDGEGMSPEVQSRALEPFFSTKGHGTGVGLGLFSVQTMVRQSGGFLDFESEPGRGTTFRLYLPSGQGIEAAGAEPARATGDHGRADGNIRILVVEDQDALREATRERIETLGYEVVDAKDAQDALQILRTTPGIRLLFSDVVMPGGMSGRDLARQVMREHPGIAVLLTSGYSDEFTPSRENDPTASARVLAKPYRLRDLAQALDELLGNTRAEMDD